MGEGKSQTPLNHLVKCLAKDLKISQKDLGKAVGMTPSHLSLYLNGKLDLQSKKFTQLLKTLGINLEELLLNHLNQLSEEACADAHENHLLVHKIEQLPREHRKPILKILESLAG